MPLKMLAVKGAILPRTICVDSVTPIYRGWLYAFEPARTPSPQTLIHAIIVEQLFGFLSFLARLLALIYRLPDYILVDFRRDLDLEFSKSNMEFHISRPKMVWFPRNKKQAYRLNSVSQMWPLGLTLAITLTLNFQGQVWNLLYLNRWSLEMEK